MGVVIEVWTDVVCPWCYVGKCRLERALLEFGQEVDVVWHSFELDPRHHNERYRKLDATSRLAKNLGRGRGGAQETIQRVQATGASEGLLFRLAETKTLSSFNAHRLLYFAQEFGRREELQDRIFRAHFSEALDCEDPEVLVELAADVGLASDRALQVLASDLYADRVHDDQAAAHDLGVTGVPFYVVGRYLLSGAQSSSVLLQVLRRTLREAERQERELRLVPPRAEAPLRTGTSAG
jgi:predicted DsbA family dithiol-disulfide isomerase